MKKGFLIFGLLSFTYFLSSCYYGNEEDLFENVSCVTEGMSYSADISPIISNNCLVCHSSAANLGNVTLQGYDDITPYIVSGKLLGSIRHDSGFIPMPENSSKLNNCDISRIESWVADGFPNN